MCDPQPARRADRRADREIHVQKVYQRLGDAKELPKKMWWGTTLAADRRFLEAQKLREELIAFHKERP
jgi:hypothetical protein